MSNGKKSSNRDTSEAANAESTEQLAFHQAEPSDPAFKKVRVSFHSVRKRLADYDNLSGKAVLDGIVAAGVLRDDSPKYINKISHSQEQGSIEKTIITIDEVEE